MKRKVRVYQILNTETGDSYVGSSMYLPRRVSVHRMELRLKAHHCRALQEAWNVYGEEMFQVIELESLPDTATQEELQQAEQRWLDNVRPSYSLTLNAGKNTRLGAKCTAETRARMSESARKRDRTPYAGNQNAKGSSWTPERKAAHSAKVKAYYADPERAMQRAKRNERIAASITDWHAQRKAVA